MIVAGIFAIAAAALLWYLFDVMLLIFGGILLAVVLRAPADWLANKTHLSPPWALALVLVLITVTVVGAGWLLGAAVREQAQAVAEQAPQMLERVQERLDDYGWARDRVDTDALLEGAGQGAFLGRGLDVVSATFGALANVGLVLFMAVLFAAQPQLYVGGTLRLVPKHKRDRAAEVMHRLGETLRRWLLGQLVLMIFVGVTTAIGLWALGVTSALALGLLAGLLTFVPFLGPLVAAVIGILVSLADGVATAAWVAVLYIAVQAIEGLLEPLVQQRAVVPAAGVVAGIATHTRRVGRLRRHRARNASRRRADGAGADVICRGRAGGFDGVGRKVRNEPQALPAQPEVELSATP